MSEISLAVAPIFHRPRRAGGPDARLGLRAGHWVIRSEDFDFLDLLGHAATPILLTAAGLGAGVGTIVGAIVAAAKTGLELRRNGVRLTPNQLRVLMELERAESGLRPEQINEALLGHGIEISKSEVARVLEELEALPARSGNKAVVARQPDGTWRSIHGATLVG